MGLGPDMYPFSSETSSAFFPLPQPTASLLGLPPWVWPPPSRPHFARSLPAAMTPSPPLPAHRLTAQAPCNVFHLLELGGHVNRLEGGKREGGREGRGTGGGVVEVRRPSKGRVRHTTRKGKP